VRLENPRAEKKETQSVEWKENPKVDSWEQPSVDRSGRNLVGSMAPAWAGSMVYSTVDQSVNESVDRTVVQSADPLDQSLVVPWAVQKEPNLVGSSVEQKVVLSDLHLVWRTVVTMVLLSDGQKVDWSAVWLVE
jgi:hypothetical protein